MKIRNGFVSNSSSSSFVVVMKKKDHEDFLNSLDKYECEIMTSFECDEDTFMGEDVIVYKGMTGCSLAEDPEGEELTQELIDETGEDYIDLNEYFDNIKFPKDSIYTYLDW